MLMRSLPNQSGVLHKCRNNKHFHLNFLNHIIASGFCSKACSFFESHDASVTPADINWKSEMRFDQSFSDSMSNLILDVLKGFKLVEIDKLPV